MDMKATLPNFSQAVDSALSNQQLQNQPRAVLLLRLCTMLQSLSPDLAKVYWKQLLQVSGHLPTNQQAVYKRMRILVEPPERASLPKFVQEIIEEITAALQLSTTDQAGAMTRLRATQERLAKRSWPPFEDRSAAWVALSQAWIFLDAQESIRLLPRLDTSAREALLIQLNNQNPLAPQDWETIQAQVKENELNDAIIDMIDQENVVLQLSAKLANSVAKQLLNFLRAAAPEQGEMTSERDKNLERYFKLVKQCLIYDPALAESLMENLFQGYAGADAFKERWPERFTHLAAIISIWYNFAPLREQALGFLKTRTPSHLHNFALAHWYAQVPEIPEQAGPVLQALQGAVTQAPKGYPTDTGASEAWYLVTLVRRGMAQTALELSNASPEAAGLKPRICRAWLLTDPGTARCGITPEELKDDPIGQFITLGSNEDRVSYLRQVTANGSKSLPDAFWQKTDAMALLSILVPNMSQLPGVFGDNRLLSLYKKDEKPENQFGMYLRSHGFGQYTYEAVDPYLLAALVTWDEQYPNEVKNLLNQMWIVMQPGQDVIRLDVIRNAIFERCQNLFGANPEALDQYVLTYVKSKLVDNPIRWQEGNTIYTFALKPQTPFIFGLLTSQKVGLLSAQRRDKILMTILGRYPSSDELITAAGELYASGKDFAALAPAELKLKGNQLNSWQLGVVQTAMKNLLNLLVYDLSQGSREMQGGVEGKSDIKSL